MSTWAVSTTDLTGTRTLDGIAPNESHARLRGASAARDLALRADRDRAPGCRYQVMVDDEVAAVVVTGEDDGGHPAHAEAAKMLAELYWAPAPDDSLTPPPAAQTADPTTTFAGQLHHTAVPISGGINGQ